MRKATRFVLTMVMILVITQALSGQSLIKNSVDEFTGEHILQTSHERIGHEGFNGEAYVSFAYFDETYIMILTIHSRDSWQGLSVDNADFLFGEDRRTIKKLKGDTDVEDGYVSEEYFFFLDKKDFLSIPDLNDLRFRMNRNIYTVPPDARAMAKLVAEEITE